MGFSRRTVIKKVLIRADSSNKIGLGHVMRCLTLAKRLRETKKLEVSFMTRELGGNINQKIVSSGFKVHILESSKVEELINFIREFPIALLILDSYEIDYEMEKKIIQNINSKVLTFDDMYQKHLSFIVLNHGIQVKKEFYKGLLSSKTKLFCGSEYTILRDEFFEKYTEKKSDSVAIVLGGNDVYNLSLEVANFLKSIDPNLELSIITTSVNPNLKLLQNEQNFNLYVDIDNVAKVLSRHSFVICASGGNLFEVMALELPFINIQVASNQQSIVDFLEENLIKSTIKMEELTKGLLERKIRELKKDDIYSKLRLNFSKTKLVKDILKEIE